MLRVGSETLALIDFAQDLQPFEPEELKKKKNFLYVLYWTFWEPCFSIVFYFLFFYVGLILSGQKWAWHFIGEFEFSDNHVWSSRRNLVNDTQYYESKLYRMPLAKSFIQIHLMFSLWYSLRWSHGPVVWLEWVMLCSSCCVTTCFSRSPGFPKKTKKNLARLVVYSFHSWSKKVNQEKKNFDFFRRFIRAARRCVKPHFNQHPRTGF